MQSDESIISSESFWYIPVSLASSRWKGFEICIEWNGCLQNKRVVYKVPTANKITPPPHVSSTNRNMNVDPTRFT